MSDQAKETISGTAQADETSQNDQSQSPTEVTELSRRVVDELEDSLPDKFKGKSSYDIYKSYEHVEKEKGRISGELGQARKEAEEARNRASLLEKQLQEASTARQQPAPAPVEVDPLSSFDEAFDADPKQAIKQATKAALDEAKKAHLYADYKAKQQSQAERYNQLRKDNPDFAELENEMVAIANEYLPSLPQHMAVEPKMIDLVYAIAKGRNMDKFVSREVEKKLKAGELAREEKRNAFSESAGSTGESTEKNFADLSLDEMVKVLGKADK